MRLTLPQRYRETGVAFLKCLELQQLPRMLLGVGVTEVDLMEMATGCLAFGKGRSLPREFLVLFFWHGVARLLIDWECHLQSLSLLPPTGPPGFACYIVLRSSCPSIRFGQDSGALLSRDVCALSTFYQHQNAVNHPDLRGPPASPVNKGPMSAMAFYSPFFFLSFFWSGAF